MREIFQRRSSTKSINLSIFGKSSFLLFFQCSRFSFLLSSIQPYLARFHLIQFNPLTRSNQISNGKSITSYELDSIEWTIKSSFSVGKSDAPLTVCSVRWVIRHEIRMFFFLQDMQNAVCFHRKHMHSVSFHAWPFFPSPFVVGGVCVLFFSGKTLPSKKCFAHCDDEYFWRARKRKENIYGFCCCVFFFALLAFYFRHSFT